VCAITNPVVTPTSASTRCRRCPAPPGRRTRSPTLATTDPHDPCARGAPVRIPSGDGGRPPVSIAAAILVAGLDGIKIAAIPASRSTSICIRRAQSFGAKKLPLNLLDALRALETSAVMKAGLGRRFASYLKLKHDDWNAYSRHLTEWERQTTLDC